jgi:HAD superfamily hydrolase (TIGR01662 family)
MIQAVLFDLGHTVIDELSDRHLPSEVRPVKPMPGLLEALAQIALPMGIWTNTQSAREADVREWLRRAEIGSHFTWVITSVDAGYRKPDRPFFDYALHQAGLAADQIIFIGNQLNTDIKGAVDYGIRCVWLSDGAY